MMHFYILCVRKINKKIAFEKIGEVVMMFNLKLSLFSAYQYMNFTFETSYMSAR